MSATGDTRNGRNGPDCDFPEDPPEIPATISGDPLETGEPVVIDCDECAVRGPGCRDCVVSVLLGVPETLLNDERVALEVLAEAGLRRDCALFRCVAPGILGWRVNASN